MYLKFEHSYFELLFSTFPWIYTILITWNSQKLSSWLLCIPNVTQNKWIVLGNSPFPKLFSPFFLSFTNAISNNYCVYVFKTNKQPFTGEIKNSYIEAAILLQQKIFLFLFSFFKNLVWKSITNSFSHENMLSTLYAQCMKTVVCLSRNTPWPHTCTVLVIRYIGIGHSEGLVGSTPFWCKNVIEQRNRGL